MLPLDPSKIYPWHQIVEENEPALIECSSFSKPEWYYFDDFVPSDVVVDVNEIYIDEVTAKNSGIYECLGITYLGQTFWAKSSLYVEGKF